MMVRGAKAPQCEDGYTRLANELLEALLRADLAGREWKVIMAVARKTYGYHKKADYLSHSQMAKLTAIGRPHVCTVLHGLAKRNIISVTSGGNGGLNKLAIQKDYSKWVGVPVDGTGVTEKARGVTVGGNKSVTVDGTHKRKKEITKERGHSPVPKKGNTPTANTFDEVFLATYKKVHRVDYLVAGRKWHEQAREVGEKIAPLIPARSWSAFCEFFFRLDGKVKAAGYPVGWALTSVNAYMLSRASKASARACCKICNMPAVVTIDRDSYCANHSEQFRWQTKPPAGGRA